MRAGQRVGLDERARSGRGMSWYLSRECSTEREWKVSAPGPKMGWPIVTPGTEIKLLRTRRSGMRRDVYRRGSRLGGPGPRRARHVKGV